MSRAVTSPALRKRVLSENKSRHTGPTCKNFDPIRLSAPNPCARSLEYWHDASPNLPFHLHKAILASQNPLATAMISSAASLKWSSPWGYLKIGGGRYSSANGSKLYALLLRFPTTQPDLASRKSSKESEILLVKTPVGCHLNGQIWPSLTRSISRI